MGMGPRRIFKYGVTAIAIPLGIIGAINIEVVATTFGLDRLLVDLLKVNNMASLWPWVSISSVIGIAVGAWIYGWLPKTWNNAARLTLSFDNELAHATATCQEGVNWYYWYHFPALAVDWKSQQISSGVGYVMVFLAFDFPMHNNNSRVCVVGGGIPAELLGSNPAGATVRVMGDVRGRTIDIRFSNTPIPI